MPSVASPVHTASGKSHRFHLLDGLRGIAAILVAIYHVPLLLRPHLLLENGWLAVDFFFCLSGFVLAYSYQERFNKGMKIRDFVVARLIRLYPLYLLGTIVGLASAIFVGTHAKAIHFEIGQVFRALPFALLMLPNFSNHPIDAAAFPLDIPGWSLYFELLANVAFAVLLRLRLASSAVVAVLIASSCTVFAVLIVRHSGSMNVGWTLATLAPGYARVVLSFFLGVLVLRFYARQTEATGRFARSGVYPVVATGGILAAIGPSFQLLTHAGVQLAVIALAFPTLVYLGARSTVPRALIVPCALLGDLSYPIYVLHSPMVLPFGGSRTSLLLQRDGVSIPAFLALLLIGVVLLSWLAGRFYDQPVRSWLTRRYISMRRPTERKSGRGMVRSTSEAGQEP